MMENKALLTLTADIVSAHVASNTVALSEVSGLVRQVHETLSGLGKINEVTPEPKLPVVSVRSSVKPDYIVCMECGKKQKMLKSHLRRAHAMSPDQYRQDYGLPASYPMIAETYSNRRRELAMTIGLGRKFPPVEATPDDATGAAGPQP